MAIRKKKILIEWEVCEYDDQLYPVFYEVYILMTGEKLYKRIN